MTEPLELLPAGRRISGITNGTAPSARLPLPVGARGGGANHVDVPGPPEGPWDTGEPMSRTVAAQEAAQDIRIVMVSPVRIYRQGLAHLLDSEDGVELVGSVSGVDAAVGLLERPRVDVLLLDMTGVMAGSHGLDTLHRLAGLSPVPCVVMGIPERTAGVVSLAEAGIAGYVTSENSFTDLLDTLRSATRGEFVCEGNVAAGLVERLAVLAKERRTVSLPQLTAREQEIAVLLESGLSNKQIAGLLHVQLTTVKNHVHNVLEKLGVRSRAEAAAMVRRYQPVDARSRSGQGNDADQEGSCAAEQVPPESS